jgi:hypothetical protein
MISAERMSDLQKNLVRAECFLKEKHQRNFVEAFRESNLVKMDVIQ